MDTATKINTTTKVLEENKEDLANSEILQDIAENIARVKMNAVLRVKLAKKLNIDEKRALEWKIVKDVFACFDTATFAKEHPEDATKLLKITVTIVGAICSVACPVLLAIVPVIDLLPTKYCAKIVELIGYTTPEYYAHKFTDSQSEKAEKKIDYTKLLKDAGVEEPVKAIVVEEPEVIETVEVLDVTPIK